MKAFIKNYFKMKNHGLKIIQPYFTDVKIGLKKFELRKNDRDFKVGDTLTLFEHNGKGATGRSLMVEVTYILTGGMYGLESDYVIMGIKLWED